jgi:MoxR-like ATPase
MEENDKREDLSQIKAEGVTVGSVKSEQFKTRVDLSGVQNSMGDVRTEIEKIIVGQKQMIDLLLIAILADGHVLIEGVPGVAKTLTAKLLAKTISVDFSRIQFTPDLMPSDIIGTSIFNQKTTDFEFRKGPLFSNIVLIDEINRAPAKTQSALFEVMEERQITADGSTYIMTDPYIVLATQNPIEQEGTYRLPEAQLDRFLFKIEVGYPSLEDETKLLSDFHGQKDKVNIDAIKGVISAAQIIDYRNKVAEIHVEENLIKYITQIVGNTRNNSSLFLGASPRASLAILGGAKATAAINGRDFITPDDVKFVAPHVLKHRIILTPEKEMEGVTPAEIVTQLIAKIEVPR